MENTYNTDVKFSDFAIAVPAAVVFLGLFVLLQKLGIVNLVSGNQVSLGTAFVIGIVASLSTCMAVVGGLVLSVSTHYAKAGHARVPQLLFHVGRLVSFFVLGGVIGAIGSAFMLSGAMAAALGIAVALVMLILGLNLLEIRWSRRLQVRMPKGFFKITDEAHTFTHALAPLILGVATFFLPCGFTQAMQIYTLTTGGFLAGGMTMIAFALGTLPVLGALSFGSLSLNAQYRRLFFKTAGIVVIAFALYNLSNSFSAIGVIPPLLNL